MTQAQLQALATQAAQRNGVPVPLFLGLIRAESGWRVDAGSPAGARGLTQLMPGTARGLGVTNILDPQQNLNGGAKYLAAQLKAFGGDQRLALAAYNAGPGAARKALTGYAETRAYVPRVLEYAKSYGGAAATAAPAPAAGAPAPASYGPPSAVTTRTLTAPPTLAPQSLAAIQRYLKLTEAQVMAGESPAPVEPVAAALRFTPARYATSTVEGPAVPMPTAPAAPGARVASTGGGGPLVYAGELPSNYRGGEGGNWGGSAPRSYALVRALGVNPSSLKRETVRTASGNVSDHYVGATSSFATDLPAAGVAGDRLLERLSAFLGRPLRAGQWNNANVGGYRYQVGWKTPGHYDHLHVGVRPA